MSRKPIDLVKIREADALMREARGLNARVRLPLSFDLERILSMAKSRDKTPGRPRGAEPTVPIALRIPESMCHQLDAHVAQLEAQTGLKASRTEVCRHALRLYLEEQSAPSKPKADTPKRTRTSVKAAKGAPTCGAG
jgi:Arc/MetJ-type ribon-helix-helix transcriptional regulator